MWDCRILGVYSFSCAVCLSGYEFIDSTIDSNGTKWEEKGRERETPFLWILGWSNEYTRGWPVWLFGRHCGCEGYRLDSVDVGFGALFYIYTTYLIYLSYSNLFFFSHCYREILHTYLLVWEWVKKFNKNSPEGDEWYGCGSSKIHMKRKPYGRKRIGIPLWIIQKRVGGYEERDGKRHHYQFESHQCITYTR